jgi:hypothetical protein
MNKKLTAGFMAALMALVTAVSPVLATGLGEYPDILGVDGELDAYVVVGVDAASSDVVGAVDVAVRLAELSYREVIVGAAVVTGVETEDVPFNTNVSASNMLKENIKHFDVPNVLKDSTIDFTWADGSGTYDFQEIIIVNNSANQQVETSSLANKDYEDSPALHIATAGLMYVWQFDENFNTSKISATYPLEIEILGHALAITTVASTQFTATIADSYYLTVGESVEVSGKTVTLLNVGSTSAVVDVDGTSEIVAVNATKTISGLKVKVSDVLSRTTLEESAATLLIGAEISKTYQDEDEFIGESKTDPDWRWELGGITTGNAKHKIAVKYAKTLNDPDDNPPGPGEALVFPNDYIQLSFDGLTSHTTATYNIEYKDGVDLSNAGGSTSAKTIRVSSTATSDPLYMASGIGTGNYTDTIHLYVNATGNNQSFVFYEDTDNKIQYAGLAYDGTHFANIVYQDTTMNLKWYNSTSADSTLVINETQTTPTAGNLTIEVMVSSAAVAGLDGTVSYANGNEIIVYGTAMGTREEDVLTNYGAVIRAPKSNAGSDKVSIDVPSAQVKATLTVEATDGVTTTVGETEKVIEPITSAVAKLDTEVDKTEKSMVLIGGPCVNDLVGELADAGELVDKDGVTLTCAGWPGRNFGIISVVDDAFATGNYVVVVAGTRAEDTRTACTVLQQYDTLLDGVTESSTEVTAATAAGISPF